MKVTFSVRSLSFSSPGDDAGIRFVWGTDEYTGRISMKFPIVSIDMKEPSVNNRLVYFPVLLKSGFGDRMWSASSGGMSVASASITDSPIATPTNNGVEVTFAWQIPESVESGTYRVEFHLIPQRAEAIEATALSAKAGVIRADACDVDEQRFARRLTSALGENWLDWDVEARHGMDSSDLAAGGASILAKGRAVFAYGSSPSNPFHGRCE